MWGWSCFWGEASPAEDFMLHLTVSAETEPGDGVALPTNFNTKPSHIWPSHPTLASPFFPLLECLTYLLCLSPCRWQAPPDCDCDLPGTHMAPDRSPREASRLYQTRVEMMQPWKKQWGLAGGQHPWGQPVKLMSNTAVQGEFRALRSVELLRSHNLYLLPPVWNR